jgi:hypothetical protein
VRPEAELIQCRKQPGALGHPGRKDHRGAAVADYLAVQAGTSDDVHSGTGIFPGQRKQYPASAGGHPVVSQRAPHGGINRAGQRPGGGSGVQHGAVFGDKRVELGPQPGK